MKINLRNDETLVLRTCDAKGMSRNNFKWPKRGPVKCHDWDPTPERGHGLHGALMGEGDGTLFNWDKDALWQVVKVKKGEVVDLGGKVKFPRGYVIFTGGRKEATDIVCDHGGIAVIGAMRVVGDGKTVVVGFHGTAIAGDYGTAIAGDYGTATAGDYGTAIAGYDGTATAGYGGTIQINYYHNARMRVLTGYIGEDGLLPNVKYRVQDGKFVKAG